MKSGPEVMCTSFRLSFCNRVGQRVHECHCSVPNPLPPSAKSCKYAPAQGRHSAPASQTSSPKCMQKRQLPRNKPNPIVAAQPVLLLPLPVLAAMLQSCWPAAVVASCELVTGHLACCLAAAGPVAMPCIGIYLIGHVEIAVGPYTGPGAKCRWFEIAHAGLQQRRAARSQPCSCVMGLKMMRG